MQKRIRHPSARRSPIFGGVGLLQTPTARMAREGEISLNYRDNDQYRYYSASVQLFPWLRPRCATPTCVQNSTAA